MSEENVEKAKTFYPAEPIEVAAVIRRDDAVEFLQSAFGDLFHPDFETVAPESSVAPSGKGFQGFVEGWRDWLSAWETWEAASEELIAVDDKVLVLTNIVASPKADQAEVHEAMAVVLTFREGRIARVALYLKRQRALEDLGLES